MWLQAVSNFTFSDICVKYDVANSVHVGIGKQETVKEAQVCNELIHEDIAKHCRIQVNTEHVGYME